MSHFLKRWVQSPESYGLRIERSGAWLVELLEGATDSRTRKRGLLGRDALDPGSGLLIAPSQAVHTFGMRFPIDIVGVDRAGCVVTCRGHVPRNRIVVALRAFAIVEVAAGEIERTGLQRGDRLVVERC